MASSHISLAARALVHGPVKLCGLTSVEDVQLAARAGATHAGLILVADSPRAVDIPAAVPLAAAARARGMMTVGVFRDAKVGEVLAAAKELELDAVQLHGDESQIAIASLRMQLPEHVEIWGLCAVGGTAARARPGTDRTIFDTAFRGRSGGTGRPFSWPLLAGRADLDRAFLAGGITPQNAAAAARVGAYGLDVCSGVEASPGRKDAARVEQLFAALRPSARTLSHAA
jgi:indole-3-glycerol phosphate synthase/phosphoribosylanthranilate isomerase